MQKNAKKAWLRFCVAVVLGAVTTVGVAWGYALSRGEHPMYDKQRKAYVREGTEYAFVAMRKQPARLWTSVYRLQLATNSRGRVESTGMFVDMKGLVLPKWSKAADVQARGWAACSDLSNGTLVVDEAYGWPMPCLRSTMKSTTGPKDIQPMVREIEGGIRLKVRPHSWFDLPSVLPYTPVWPGLAVDLGLFSAAWWSVFWLYVANKRLKGSTK